MFVTIFFDNLNSGLFVCNNNASAFQQTHSPAMLFTLLMSRIHRASGAGFSQNFSRSSISSSFFPTGKQSKVAK